MSRGLVAESGGKNLPSRVEFDPCPEFHPGPDWFAASRPPFGDRTIGLRIGPLRLVLEGLSQPQWERLAARYRPFLEIGEGEADLTIRLTRAAVDSFLVPQTRSELYRIERRTDARGRCWWSYEFAGRLEAGRAELALVEEEGERFDRGVENLLRVLTAEFVLARGGLLVHGATVVRNGRAYIFFGPSGAGKTTVTRLSPADLVLSDDLTLVLETAEGPRAAGIPFGMAHHHVPESNEAFPIAGLHRLVQSSQVRRTPLTGARAMAEVVSSLPFVLQEGQDPAAPMENAARLLSAVPVWRLEFRKDDAFWKVIEER